MDRISQLPDFIVHHILSFLNNNNNNNTLDPTELVRMSVLSKTWFHLTASFPFLDFTIHKFISRERFLKYVEYTTSRFCHQNVPAHSFKLVTTIKEPAELDIVNRCLELLLKKGVKVLDIGLIYFKEFFSDSATTRYHLPNILLSVSVLESLTIRYCELPSSLMLDVVMFKSLVYLKLKLVNIDDEVIKHLTTSCPRLQELRIINCDGWKRFCVYEHYNLQRVRIHYHSPVEIIDIQAPNLSLLLVKDRTGGGAPPQMNLASCKKLTTVTYMGRSLPNSNGFTDFLSNFPFVENLVLAASYRGNNRKLSSHSLRTLVLYSNDNLRELADIEFNAPNLGLFIYSYKICGISPVTRLPQLQAFMQSYPNGQIIDIVWFHKLWLFLGKEGGFGVLNLYIQTRKFTELEKLKAAKLQPYEVDHVELHLDTHEDHAAFVDAILCCCRPRSLTLRSSSPFIDFEDVAKFTHEKLLQQEDHGHTSIQIVSHSSSEAQKHLKVLMQLPGALFREGEAVSFIKEEVLQEEACGSGDFMTHWMLES